MDKRRGGKGEKGKKKKMRGEKKEKKDKYKEGQFRYFHNPNPAGEAVLPSVFQNNFFTIREAAPPEESKPEPELFSEQPEPYEKSPNSIMHMWHILL